MDGCKMSGRIHGVPVRGAPIDEADISRFLAGLLLRLAAAAFAVALASAGHGVTSMDGAKVIGTLHQANETGAAR
ncbi:MAG: hypothetical protein IH590_09200 [Aquamicrobium sp.]|nr:hypothetical protein [Aquamicrobium sp.]